ncbi:hypothetical protein, partial [Mesorhizobium sp. WSM3866]|uniref:hypothetical protein n=1 Tax=Mesorhizobium sp. WSM3866 TaxID=422271 RepID=UPI001FE1FB7D
NRCPRITEITVRDLAKRVSGNYRNTHSKHAIDLLVYLFGRDALPPGSSQEFKDKIGNGPWVFGAHVLQMFCHPPVQKFQSPRAHAKENLAAA